MGKYLNLTPIKNFGPMLPNGRNATGMSKEDIYFAIHGKTQRQVQKEMKNDQETDD